MKHQINSSYPDETHYTVAILNDEEEERLVDFLERNESEEIKDE